MSICSSVTNYFKSGAKALTEKVLRTNTQRGVASVGAVGLAAILGLPAAALACGLYGTYCWHVNAAELAAAKVKEEAEALKQNRRTALEEAGALPPKAAEKKLLTFIPPTAEKIPVAQQHTELGAFPAACSFVLHDQKEPLLKALRRACTEEYLLGEKIDGYYVLNSDNQDQLEKIRDEQGVDKAVALHKLGQTFRNAKKKFGGKEVEELEGHLLTLKKGGFPKGINAEEATQLLVLLQLYRAASSTDISKDLLTQLNETLHDLSPDLISEEIEDTDPVYAIHKLFDAVNSLVEDRPISGGFESIESSIKGVFQYRDTDDDLQIPLARDGFELRTILIKNLEGKHATVLVKERGQWVWLNHVATDKRIAFKSFEEALKVTRASKYGQGFYYQRQKSWWPFS